MRVDNAIDDVVLSCANRCGRGFMALQCLPLEGSRYGGSKITVATADWIVSL